MKKTGIVQLGITRTETATIKPIDNRPGPEPELTPKIATGDYDAWELPRNQSFKLPILGADRRRRARGRHRHRRRAAQARRGGGDGRRGRAAPIRDRPLVRPDGQPAVHQEPARDHDAAGLRADGGARLPGQGGADRPRLQGRGHRRPRQRRPPLRQGVRQPRPVQPDLLHRRKPGEVPDRAGRAGQARAARHGREVRLPDGGRLRPLPLRHVRHRVPQGAARRRLRRLPRHAVPAEGRPQAGHRRRGGPGDEPGVLHRPAQGDPGRRRHQRHGLPPAPVRGRGRRHRPRDREHQAATFTTRWSRASRCWRR